MIPVLGTSCGLLAVAAFTGGIRPAVTLPEAGDTTVAVARGAAESASDAAPPLGGPLQMPEIGVVPPDFDERYDALLSASQSSAASPIPAPVAPVPAPAPAPVTPTPTSPPPVEPSPSDDVSPPPPPADEPPAEEPPAEETPAEETPAEETPAEETPAEETPAEQTPAEQTPAEETPAEETSAEQAPAEETPAEQTPAEQTPAEETPTDEPSTDAPPAEGTLTDQPPAEESPAGEPTTMPPPAEEPPAEEPSAEVSPAEEPPAEGPAEAPPAEEPPADEPVEQPVEDVELGIGESFDVLDASGELAFTIVVDGVVPDVVCTAEGSRPAENGHLVGVQLRVTAGPASAAGTPPPTIGAANFGVVGAAGDPNTPSATACLDGTEDFPSAPPSVPAQEARGTVVLDVADVTGAVTFRSAAPAVSLLWRF
jgi:hypothetical protein